MLKQQKIVGSFRALQFLATGALVTLAAFGCSSGEGSSTGGTSVASSDDALEGNLTSCGQAARDCKAAAGDDATALATCKDEFKTCAEQAQQAAQQVHDAIQSCFDTARTCFSQVADGGSRKECGQALRTCVQAALPERPKSPCEQAFDTCRAGAGDSGAAPEQCRADFRACVEASLPPCVRTMHEHMSQGRDIRGCAHEARECIGGHHGEGDAGAPGTGGHLPGDGGMGSWPGTGPGADGGASPWPGMGQPRADGGAGRWPGRR